MNVCKCSADRTKLDLVSKWGVFCLVQVMNCENRVTSKLESCSHVNEAVQKFQASLMEESQQPQQPPQQQQQQQHEQPQQQQQKSPKAKRPSNLLNSAPASLQRPKSDQVEIEGRISINSNELPMSADYAGRNSRNRNRLSFTISDDSMLTSSNEEEYVENVDNTKNISIEERRKRSLTQAEHKHSEEHSTLKRNSNLSGSHSVEDILHHSDGALSVQSAASSTSDDSNDENGQSPFHFIKATGVAFSDGIFKTPNINL